MSKGGGQRQIQVPSTTSTEPPAFARPYLRYGMEEASRQYRTAQPEYFPGSGVVGESPETIAARDAAIARATAGSPLMRAAQDQQLATLRGDFLGGPAYTSMFDAATRPATQAFTEQVLPGITSQFARAGRLGSNAQQLATERATEAFGRSMADVAAQQVAAERARQMQAVAGAPALAAADYGDISALANIGGAREQRGQALLDDERRRFEFYQQRPQATLANYISNVTGVPLGQQSTTQQTYFTNPTANFLSSALSGAALGRAISPGQGGIYGALGGGLLGLL